jgi:hypothetical protein
MIHRNVKKIDNLLIQSLSKEFVNEEELMTYLKKQMAIEIIKEMNIDELSKLFIILQDDSSDGINLELILKL